jgi:hypothetical protein
MATSADQDQWVEIARALRAELAKKVLFIHAMNPGEIKELVETLDKTISLEINAETFDECLETHRKNLERTAFFGS